MPVMDEFKEEREKIKNGSLQDKAKYFWCYYKYHTIAALCAIGLIILLIHDMVTQKDSAFFAALLNCVSLGGEDVTTPFIEDFTEYAGIDLNEYQVTVDSTMDLSTDAANELATSSSQRLLVYTSAGELDVIVGGEDVFPTQANQGMFYDLREILTEEQIARYESLFYYVDQAYIDLLDSDESYDIDFVMPEAPDPDKPEEMEEPVPVGIYVTDCDRLTDVYYFSGDYAAIGVMINSSHVETSLQFIDYLFE